MNIIIASDIHGSAPHCLKFVKVCYLEQAETVLLLGDILDGNKEVAEMLNTLSREKNFSVFVEIVIILKTKQCWISLLWLSSVCCSLMAE